MNDQPATIASSSDNTPLTARDLAKGDLDKIFATREKGAAVSQDSLVLYRSPEQKITDAKMMSASRFIAAPYLRQNPGDCWSVLQMAEEFRTSVVGLMRHSYETNGIVDFTGQFYHARAETCGLLRKRLRVTYEGEGDARRCVVTGWLKGEEDPFIYTSEPLGKIIASLPNRRDGSGKGGSPLWRTNPDQQLHYRSVKNWVRLHIPEAMLLLPPDEEPPEPIGPRDITDEADALAQRLMQAEAANGGQTEGYRDGVVEGALAEASGEAQDVPKPRRGRPPKARTKNAPTGRRSANKRHPKPRGGQDDPDRGPEVATADPVRVATTIRPATPSEYEVWLRAWVEAATPDEIRARWLAERQLRVVCAVPVDDSKALFEKYVSPRIAA